MNTNIRSILTASLLGVSLAATLTLAACRTVRVSPDEIFIEGDVGATVRAKTLEQSLQQAMDNKVKAEERGDKAGAADWAKIIADLTAKKKNPNLDKKALMQEGESTGTVTESTNDKGQTVYTWIPSAGGESGPSSL